MNELFNQLEDIFKKAFTFFDGFTAKTEGIVFDELMKQMLEYDLKDGRIDNKSKKNLSILNSTNKTLKDLLNPAKFKSETSKYLKNFDEVERIQKLMLEKENKLNLKDFDLSKEKKALMNEIVDGVLNQKMIDVNMVNPIKKIIAKHITSGITYEDARNEIRNFIISDESRRGFLGQYLHVLTKEPLLRYDGAINQKAVDEFQLDGFRIVGSLIIGSMPVCRAMVKGTGKFSKLTKNGKYRVEDIDKIIDIIKTEPGFVKGTNKSNYFIYRNHWGCRHAFVPTRLLDRDLEAFEGMGEEINVEFKTIDDAKDYIKSKGVKNIDLGNSKIEHYNEIAKALTVVPKEAIPTIIGNKKVYEETSGLKINRKSDEWLGISVKMDIYDRSKNDYVGEKLIAINTNFKTPNEISQKKIKYNDLYSEKMNGHKWYFNTFDGATHIHEMGHLYDKSKNISIKPEWISLTNKWHLESKIDMIKVSKGGDFRGENGSEAFAEAFASYYGNNKNGLPNYIIEYLDKNLK